MVLFSLFSTIYGFDCPEPNGIFADPLNCQWFYTCSNGVPDHDKCDRKLMFDEVIKVCNFEEMVECGDRPKPGSSTPEPTTTTKSTTTTPSTTAPTTTTATTNPPPTTTEYQFHCPTASGLFPDPFNCQWFYSCSNGKAVHDKCDSHLLYDEEFKVCDFEENVECGDRPRPGSTTTKETTTSKPTTTSKSTTTSKPSTSTTQTTPESTTSHTRPTTTITPTTTTSTTTTPTTTTTRTPNPNPGPLPDKVMSLYIIITDETIAGYTTDDDWQPILYEWQQTNSNVLFFTFIHPAAMKIPIAFKNLAMTRGSSAAGAVPEDTKIIFAIGGFSYSVDPNPWPWLVSKATAEAMAANVATWPSVYGCDGIDLDIEEGAGSTSESGANLVYFLQKLRQLNPDIIITQPTYGFPQIRAEMDVINASWKKDTTSTDLAAEVGLMVYQGTESLQWVDQYTHGADHGQGITVNVPSKAILLGARGAATNSDIMILANAAVAQDLMGIMVWYASVKNGFLYEAGWDASRSPESIVGYGAAMELFDEYNP